MIVNFEKGNGQIPVVIQDDTTLQVLMLGYMTAEALAKTQAEGEVTFYSRSKQRLWTKGETSGHKLKVVDIKLDCDQDTLLIKVNPLGPTCHKGTTSCFNETMIKGTLYQVEDRIQQRVLQQDIKSYTVELLNKGINKVAQKVGEEAVELVIEAKDNNVDLFKNEAADLLYHFLVLLKAKQLTLEDIEAVLRQRMK